MKNQDTSQEEPEIIQSKEQEYLEGWKRARADLENVQKRMNDTRIQERAILKRTIAEPLIVLADNFRSLIEHAPDTKDPWAAGVLHVARQFDQILEEFGVELIQDTGIVFDPVIHEAIEEVEGEEGKIIEVVQVGYKIGDITVRPAKVKVGKGSDETKLNN
ncbi:MAG: nucleotide exchange factor GrpE [bacterium]|nr:nucleotide exchange factor GrpE [bacterium]